MSDTSQGPGWFEASDGKWYAPKVVYEHITIMVGLNRQKQIAAVNDAALDGWELDHGTETGEATLRRQIVPLAPPEDLTRDWKPDPSGRFTKRGWDGTKWTYSVGDEKNNLRRDPPTLLKPADYKGVLDQ